MKNQTLGFLANQSIFSFLKNHLKIRSLGFAPLELKDFNINEMISNVSGKIELFDSSIKIDIKKNQVDIKYPQFRSLLTDLINKDNFEIQFLSSICLSENYESNIAALCSIGLIFSNNTRHLNSHYIEENLKYFYLCLCPQNDFDLSINYEKSKNYLNDDLLLQIEVERGLYKELFDQFKSKLIQYTLDAFKINENNVGNIRHIFKKIGFDQEYFKGIRLSDLKVNKFEISILNNLAQINNQIDQINQINPDLLYIYNNALNIHVINNNFSLKEFNNNFDVAIDFARNNSENHTMFYRLLGGLESFEKRISFISFNFNFEKIYSKLDILSLILNTLKLENKNNLTEGLLLKKTLENGDIQKAILALMILATLDKSRNQQELIEDSNKLLLIILHYYKGENLINKILSDHIGYYEADANWVKSYSNIVFKMINHFINAFDEEILPERSSSEAKKLISGKYDFVELFRSDAPYDINAFDQETENLENLNEFFKIIRKFLSLNMIANLSSDSKDNNTFGYKKANLIDIKSHQAKKLCSWSDVFKVYQDTDTYDSFINVCMKNYYEDFLHFGVFYILTIGSENYLIQLERCNSKLPNYMNDSWSDERYYLNLVSKIGCKDQIDLNPEAFKLALELCNKINSIE
jgi:hypothetical protein